jgi:hypothetical protein
MGLEMEERIERLERAVPHFHFCFAVRHAYD